MKSILMLLFLLTMIYYQHSPLIHAEDGRMAVEAREPGCGSKAEESGEGRGYEKRGDDDRKKGDGEEESEDDDRKKEEGEEERRDDDGQKEDGEEENGEEENGAAENGEENGAKENGTADDGEDDDKTDVEKEKEEEPETVVRYRLKFPPADGKNGFYVTAPTVVLEHRSPGGKTVYCLRNNGEIAGKGKLSGKGNRIIFGKRQFREGENTLTVYMEDGTGEEIADTIQEKTILLDTQAPSIIIGGISDQMTVKRTVEVMCRVFENNKLEYSEARIKPEDMDGEKHILPKVKWNSREGISETLFALSEDGTYHIEVTARDEAGNSDVKRIMFTIDRRPEDAMNVPDTPGQGDGCGKSYERGKSSFADSQKQVIETALAVLDAQPETFQSMSAGEKKEDFKGILPKQPEALTPKEPEGIKENKRRPGK